jgi:carboxyl-terminal processing protease
MSRQAYVENYLFYRTSTTAYSFGGKKAKDLQTLGEPLACLDEDTAYIRLTQFAGDADERFDELMNLFKEEGKKHLVLDLRDNGGGYLDIMQGIAKYFTKNTTENRPLAVIADYGEIQKGFNAKGNLYNDYFTEDSHIYVLADNGTASASECLIGFMVDYGAVDFSDICLIERNGAAKTYGKGIMQTTFLMGLTGDAIRLTTAEIRWPVSNRSIHDRGVLPEDGAKSVPANHYGDGEIESALTTLVG